MDDLTEALLKDLTEPQREAVTHLDGPALVLAGPGSGKTTVVTRRVGYLIAQGIPPWQVLALTFTNKAAGEMRRRIDRLVPAGEGLTIATFHAFCARLLRRFAVEAGLPPRFTIYDAADQREAIKQALEQAELSRSNWTPATVAGAISNGKNRLLDADGYAAEANDFFTRSVAKVFHRYQALMRDNGAVDFDDLLLKVAVLLRRCDPVRDALRRRFQYLLVDEYQDTNHAQFVIAHALAAEHRNIFVVGDPDQSIYGWRGADLSNILEFEEHFPQAKVVPLGRNFRSTGLIVHAASTLIRHNRRRKHKQLHTELEDGLKPQVIHCHDEHDEARLIVDQMRRRHEEQEVPWREMVVLYRMNALSRVLEEAFRNAQVPYVIARGTAFYERKEVKDALSYLRLIVNRDDEVALRRVVNDPPRGIGRTSLERLEVLATDRGLSLADALSRAGEAPGVSARARASAGRFTAMLDRWRTLAEGPWSGLAALIEQVIGESGLEKHYRSSRDQQDQDRLANLAELISAAAQFQPVVEADDRADPPTMADALASFLESASLVSDADAVDPDRGSVTLMTMHTAKGLEYALVAVVGLEQGLLPHARSVESDVQLEEERRLLFVGMTRARRHLLLTRAAVRTQRGLRQGTIPSQFLDELPADAVAVSNHAGIDGDLAEEPWEDSRPAGHPGTGLTVGCRVRHPTFGFGRVKSIMPRPGGASARIAFDQVGLKTLVLGYAPLQRVE